MDNNKNWICEAAGIDSGGTWMKLRLRERMYPAVVAGGYSVKRAPMGKLLQRSFDEAAAETQDPANDTENDQCL